MIGKKKNNSERWKNTRTDVNFHCSEIQAVRNEGQLMKDEINMKSFARMRGPRVPGSRSPRHPIVRAYDLENLVRTMFVGVEEKKLNKK